jgi:hypothetical protein
LNFYVLKIIWNLLNISLGFLICVNSFLLWKLLSQHHLSVCHNFLWCSLRYFTRRMIWATSWFKLSFGENCQILKMMHCKCNSKHILLYFDNITIRYDTFKALASPQKEKYLHACNTAKVLPYVVIIVFAIYKVINMYKVIYLCMNGLLLRFTLYILYLSSFFWLYIYSQLIQTCLTKKKKKGNSYVNCQCQNILIEMDFFY